MILLDHVVRCLQDRTCTRRGKIPEVLSLTTARCEAAEPSSVITLGAPCCFIALEKNRLAAANSAVSHCWLLEACSRACASHLRPAVLVACLSVRDVHCRNVDVCECHGVAISAHHSAYCCLYRDVSLVHHVQCYASQTWKVLSCVWTTKDFACDASTLGRGDHSWADLFALAHAETLFLWDKRPNDW
jgi:hypothetical protein